MIILKTFSTPFGNYVYDRETNTILSVEKDDFDALTNISKNDFSELDKKVLIKYQNKGFCKESILNEIEHPDNLGLKYYLNNRIQKITLQLTQNCNLRCDYCAYSGKYNQRSHNQNRMSIDIIKDSIDFAMKRSIEIKCLNIGFYGGEPLLEFENIKKAIRYVENNYPTRETTYSLTTNGTLFTEEIIKFFIDKNISVLISLDGPKEIHDINRVFANGKGSFNNIINNLEEIKVKYPEFLDNISFNTVIPPGNDYRCINDFFNANELFIANSLFKATVSKWNSKNSITYDDKYFETYNYEYFKILLAGLGLYSKEKISKLFVSDILAIERFHKSLGKSSIAYKAHPGGPCIPGARRPMIDYKGDIFSCEKVSETSDIMKIGNIYTGFDEDKVSELLNIGKITKDECKKCWNFIHCGLCMTAADGQTELSKDKKLIHCNGSRNSTLNTMYTVCMLNELGYDFKGGFFNEKEIDGISS